MLDPIWAQFWEWSRIILLPRETHILCVKEKGQETLVPCPIGD